MIGIGDKMKKIMSDKSFWIILIISVISLVVFTVGVIFLTRKNTKEFYSAGYIINSTASKTDKYYFDDNTVYKENIFNEYVFKDVDDKEVSTGKNNFIHYLDKSLSFMKNGVILDLDNFNENIAPYYNITDKSIVRYNNGGYYIETADKTLVFGNFLGRITDNKYIVVGNDIRVKLAGNDESVHGEYFEILFVEAGIVKIENQEGSYQTVSDNSVIYIGENIKINLGDKSVNYGEEVKLSLSELTINGNENIDIVPQKPVNNETTPGEGEGTGTNQGQGNGTGNNNEEGGENTPGGETTTVLKKEVAVNLIEASTGVNSIHAKIQVIDTIGAIKGNLVLKVVNTINGKTVYEKLLVNTPEEQSVHISSLPSNCNYVMTIVDTNNETETQYFQKSFRTDSLDLKLIRGLVTENSLSYSLDFGTKGDVVRADISLFDEEENELGSYTVERDNVTTVKFDGLTNNTLYNVVVDNVVVNNVQYDTLYSSRTSDLTLKNKPTLGEISVKTNNDTKNFTLKMDSVVDDDKAIVKYVYEIYKADDITEETITTATPVYSFSRNELDDEILKLDEAKNLFGNVDYRFKIVAQYYDNYRYNEIETRFSDYFQIVGKPTITFEASEIDINRIAGTIYIEDADCTIPFEGRKCSENSNNSNEFIVRYYGGVSSIRNTVENVVFDSNDLTLTFDLNGLQENTMYTFEVYADVDLHNENGIQKGQYIGGFNVKTAGIDALMMQNWQNNGYSFENPISVSTEMVSTNPEDDSVDKLSSIRFNLYNGNVENYLDFYEPIASFVLNDDVKNKIYNKAFTINSSMFQYTDSETNEILNLVDLEVLKQLSGGKLNRYYTIEITDAYDDTNTNEFVILNNTYVYEVPSILLLEDQVMAPEIVVEEITNKNTKNDIYLEDYNIKYISQLDDEIIRGYKVTAVFDKNKIESYFATSNPITKINFYINDNSGNLIEEKNIDFVNNEEYTAYFFLKQGTDYHVSDTDFRRGNEYTFSYNLSIDDDGDPSNEELVFPSSKPTSDVLKPIKQAPSFKLYIDNSTKDSVTYRYQVYDYDNALYQEEGKYYIYYSINGNEEIYTTEYVKDGSNKFFTLSNLSNGVIYNIEYYSAVVKKIAASKVKIGNYYFDGYYDSADYTINFDLEYGNFDNRLKIIVKDNEFLSRISSYLVTLDANGEKYQKVISDLDTCDDNKCIIVDYKHISSFKGKDIKVTVDAFYDNGYIGFGQKSIIGDYLNSLGYVTKDEVSKSGFVYQTIGSVDKGKYFYVTNNGYSGFYDYPRGILGFEFTTTNNLSDTWNLNSVNLVDINNNNFVKYGEITIPSNKTNVIPSKGTVSILTESLNVTPKVLDKMSLVGLHDNFMFTSITPKVYATPINAYNGNSLINGAIMNINVSLDLSTLDTDFVKTEGKYKFYIDIYTKNTCSEGESCNEFTLIKTVETDYDNLSNIVVDGLKPATEYYYKISADMNKNGSKVKTPLFDYNKSGYVEFMDKFSTLKAEEIFNKVTYDYKSFTTNENYSNRELSINTYLKNIINFDVKIELFDIDGNREFSTVINNSDIKTETKLASYIHDISGNNFVFGPDYHTLVITAITTDNNENELELYNDKLVDDALKAKNFHKLYNPTFILRPSAGINLVNGVYDYSISSDVIITDKDKVIKNGIFYIELQDATYSNACPGNEDDCRATVNMKNKTCTFNDGKVESCIINSQDSSSLSMSVKFDGLKADTNYSIYVYADTYRNNVDLSEKDGLVYVRKNQYTKSSLDFSLGAVTPTAVSKNEIQITFVGASNIEEKLVGIKYTVTVQGAGQIASGSIGTTDKTTGELTFAYDKDGYYYISIPIEEGNELGLNNYIIISYYYKDSNGNVQLLDIGGNTSYQYTVKNKD